MKKSKQDLPEFVVCIKNEDYPASLGLHKIYRVLGDKDAATGGIFVLSMRVARIIYTLPHFLFPSRLLKQWGNHCSGRYDLNNVAEHQLGEGCSKLSNCFGQTRDGRYLRVI